MRHRRRTKYFGVKTAHRKAMFRNMVTSLFRHGRITTTVTRAKELRRVADKLISLAKEGSLHSRRQALSFIMDKGVVGKLFSEIAPQMAERRGGYTRIVRIGPRRGDGAMMCIIELVTESLSVPGSKKRKEEAADQVAPTVIPEASSEAEAQDDKGDLAAEAEAVQTSAETEENVSSQEINESDTTSEEEALEAEKGEVAQDNEQPEKTEEAEASESDSSEEAPVETEVKDQADEENLTGEKKE